MNCRREFFDRGLDQLVVLLRLLQLLVSFDESDTLLRQLLHGHLQPLFSRLKGDESRLQLANLFVQSVGELRLLSSASKCLDVLDGGLDARDMTVILAVCLLSWPGRRGVCGTESSECSERLQVCQVVTFVLNCMLDLLKRSLNLLLIACLALRALVSC